MYEYEVKVEQWTGRKYYMMTHIDPVTEERHVRSTKETTEREALRWEAELNEGGPAADGRILWADFRERCDNKKLAKQAKKTREATDTAFNHVERILNPKRLASLNERAISKLKETLENEGLAETSVSTHLAHLHAALSWAASKSQKLLARVPDFDMPERQKGQKLMRGRPITAEEHERMLAVTPEIRRRDFGAWQRYLVGLWLSGLRLEESLIVSWDGDVPFSIDLSGEFPLFRIYAEAEKGKRDRLLPMTPDFSQFILSTPQAEREGLVFKLGTVRSDRQMSTKRVSRIVSQIGKRAGVVVDKAKGRHATAHDYRRAFGTRWARRVKKRFMLQVLMRHKSIETTQTYYIEHDANDMAQELWQENPPMSDHDASCRIAESHSSHTSSI